MVLRTQVKLRRRHCYESVSSSLQAWMKDDLRYTETTAAMHVKACNVLLMQHSSLSIETLPLKNENGGLR